MDVLWIELVNSDWRDHLGREPDVDRLDDDHWLGNFAKRAGGSAGELCSPAARGSLKKLRELLQQIVARWLAAKPLTDAQRAAVNQFLSYPQVQPRLVRRERSYQIAWSPVGQGWAKVQFEIVASLASFLVDGHEVRVKVCANPACRWLFYDGTRSRTRRWCASNCGSLIKVRQFRERRRQKARSKHRN